MKKRFKSILLVDDDQVSNLYHASLIENMNFAERVYIAKNGEEAISILTTMEAEGKNCPEIIFLDIRMPVMDGWDFLEEYDRLEFMKKCDSKIIILSAKMTSEDQARIIDNENIKGFYSKILRKESLEDIKLDYFSTLHVN